MNCTDSMKIAKDVVRLLRKEDIRSLIRELVREEMKATEHPVGIKEAAKIVGLAVATMYDRKDIPHFKQGKKLCYYPSQLKEWMKNHM